MVESEGQQVETSKLINLEDGVPKGKIPVRIRNKLDMNIGLYFFCVPVGSKKTIEKLIEANKPVFNNQERQVGYDLIGGETYHVGYERRAIKVYAIQYFELKDAPNYVGRLKKLVEELYNMAGKLNEKALVERGDSLVKLNQIVEISDLIRHVRFKDIDFDGE